MAPLLALHVGIVTMLPSYGACVEVVLCWWFRFQADLRLPPSVHAAARQAQVQHLIQQLGLQKVSHA